jgi:predicted transcriptional regulator
MTLAQLKEAVALGPEIYAEFTSQFGNQDPASPMVKQYVDGIRAAGVDHAFVSSDTGQINSVFQPDALAKCAKVLRANGFTEQELAKLFKINPAKILGLAPPAGTP